MKTNILGYSALRLPIFSTEFGKKGDPCVLILGGVHGDEVEGIFVAQALLGEWSQNFPYKLHLTLIPVFNVDGLLHHRRTNGHLVDLNRNLPTKDWTDQYEKEKYYPGLSANSEPENQMLVKWLDENSPQFILSLHSWKPLLNVNGDCSFEAEVLSQETGYKVVPDIGYPTPGSLGTYTGQERNIPTLTYEVERGLNFKQACDLHVPAIQKALYQTEKARKNG